jgi:hypothetical protein
MATYNKFQDFVEALGLGEHNLSTGVFKVYLTNNTPSASADADKADLAGITEEYTYVAEDIQNGWSETAGTATMTAVDVVITATGGALEAFQYVPIYNDTHTSDGLMCWADYGEEITLLEDETFTIDFGVSLMKIDE